MDRFVDTPEALADVVARARRAGLAAVDTEAASFHRYVDRIYLLQVSTRDDTAVVDPLAITDLAPLGALLGDAGVEKVFHDADYDVRILDRDYGYRGRRLFDTRIAAQLIGEPAIGLAALLQKYLGVRLSKAHQKGDWSQRPLPRAMLAYAMEDTRHLPRLRDALRERLVALGRLAWAEEEFARLETLRWTGAVAAGEAWWRVKGVKRLTPRQRAAFRALHAWREDTAARHDRAAFRVIGNDALLAVAAALPQNVDALSRVAGLPASLARRHGPQLVDAVQRALALPDAELPRPPQASPPPPRDPDVEARIARLREARNHVADRLRIEPGVLCGRATLEVVARARPVDRAGLTAVDELRSWQLEVLGDALLDALAKTP